MTEIKVHFWPATPDQRELKIRMDGDTIFSFFANSEEIIDMIISLEKAVHDMRD